MKDITTISALKRLSIFDVENPCKYYKLVYQPEMALLNTIDTENRIMTEYEISNYIITVGWNMWNKMFRMTINQNGILLRIIEYGISTDTAMVYNPQFNGSYFKLLFLFDLKSNKRPLYIYSIYEVMEGY